jgi:hypothetical protein
VLPDDVVITTSARYISAYERITGRTFTPGTQPASQRIAAAVAALRDTRSSADSTPRPDTLDPSRQATA